MADKLHVMIDWETLATVPRARVLSLGAVSFTKAGIKDKFYVNIDRNCQHNLGRVTSEDTMAWWQRQAPEARNALINPAPVSLMTAMQRLIDWRGKMPSSPHLWGNGADFDNAIIRDVFDQLQWKFPFAPFGGRCYRTVKNLPGMPKLDFKGLKHNALDDSINQAEHLIAMEKLLPGLLD